MISRLLIRGTRILINIVLQFYFGLSCAWEGFSDSNNSSCFDCNGELSISWQLSFPGHHQYICHVPASLCTNWVSCQGSFEFLSSFPHSLLEIDGPRSAEDLILTLSERKWAVQPWDEWAKINRWDDYQFCDLAIFALANYDAWEDQIFWYICLLKGISQLSCCSQIRRIRRYNQGSIPSSL